jgi:hypothetical protein
VGTAASTPSVIFASVTVAVSSSVMFTVAATVPEVAAIV